jgi:hypothetical protein
LTLGPFVATAFGAISKHWVNSHVDVGSATLSLPGVRLALWFGGLVTVLSGVAAGRRMRRARDIEVVEA